MCRLQSGAISGLLPFLSVSLGSNVLLPPFAEVETVLAGPARKPDVRHRRSRLHGKELSAVPATIRHVRPFRPGSPFAASLRADDWPVAASGRAIHRASGRAIHRAAVSASAKRCERIQSAYAISVASSLFPNKLRFEWPCANRSEAQLEDQTVIVKNINNETRIELRIVPESNSLKWYLCSYQFSSLVPLITIVFAPESPVR